MDAVGTISEDHPGIGRSTLFPLVVGFAMVGAALLVFGCLLLGKPYRQTVGYRSSMPAQLGSVSADQVSADQGITTVRGECGRPIDNLFVGNVDRPVQVGPPFFEQLPGFLCERSARQRAVVSGSVISCGVVLLGGTVYLPIRAARRRTLG